MDIKVNNKDEYEKLTLALTFEDPSFSLHLS